MGPSSLVRDHRRPLAALVLVLVVAGTGFGLLGGDSLWLAALRGTLVGLFAFVVVALVYVGVVLATPRQVRLLRGLFLGLVAIGVGVSLLAGDALSTALVRGTVAGSLNFLPVVVVASGLLVAYWLGADKPAQSG